MKRIAPAVCMALLCAAFLGAGPGHWAAPKSPAVPEASGFVDIPGAAIPAKPASVYRAILDANHGADKPDQLIPAVDNAGSLLNEMVCAKVPAKNARFAIVFHGPAMAALLDDAHYRAKFGVANPNLKALSKMKKAGVELFVCGQNLAFDGVDPATLTSDVRIASDALVVLMTYQSRGYALLTF